MENPNFNLDSIESAYGENILTAVIQLDERIEDLASLLSGDDSYTDFEKTQFIHRLEKINDLNDMIRKELNIQQDKITRMQQKLYPAGIAASS
jgi:hypothetical protein